MTFSVDGEEGVLQELEERDRRRGKGAKQYDNKLACYRYRSRFIYYKSCTAEESI